MDRILLSKIKKVNAQLADVTTNVNPTIINANVGLRFWRSAMAKMKVGSLTFLDVPVLGDSISDGVGSSAAVIDWLTKGYLGRMRQGLAAKYGDTGTGLITEFYPYLNSPQQWTYTGAWTDGPYGCVNLCKKSTTTGDTAQLSFNGSGIGLIFYSGLSGATCNVQVDGGTATPIDTYVNTGDKPKKFEITGLTDGAHTLLITSTATTGKAIFLIGAYPIKGSSGIRIHQTGRNGAKSSDFISEVSMKSCIDVFTPPLTIISLGANDFLNNINPTTFQTNMQTLINRAKTFGDVLLVSSGLSTNTQTYAQNQYMSILKQLAITNNVAFVDIYTRWSGDANFAKNTLGFINDYIHPTVAGHQDMSSVILRTIDEY